MAMAPGGLDARLEIARLRAHKSPELKWRGFARQQRRLDLVPGTRQRRCPASRQTREPILDMIDEMAARAALVADTGFRPSQYPGLTPAAQAAEDQGWVAWHILPNLRTVLQYARSQKNPHQGVIEQAVARAAEMAMTFIRGRQAKLGVYEGQKVERAITAALSGAGSGGSDYPDQDAAEPERERVNHALDIESPWVIPARPPTDGEQIATQLRDKGWSAVQIAAEMERSPFMDEHARGLLAQWKGEDAAAQPTTPAVAGTSNAVPAPPMPHAPQRFMAWMKSTPGQPKLVADLIDCLAAVGAATDFFDATLGWVREYFLRPHSKRPLNAAAVPEEPGLPLPEGFVEVRRETLNAADNGIFLLRKDEWEPLHDYMKCAYPGWHSSLNAAILAAVSLRDARDRFRSSLPEAWFIDLLTNLRELQSLRSESEYGRDGGDSWMHWSGPLPERANVLLNYIARAHLALIDVVEAPHTPVQELQSATGAPALPTETPPNEPTPAVAAPAAPPPAPESPSVIHPGSTPAAASPRAANAIPSAPTSSPVRASGPSEPHLVEVHIAILRRLRDCKIAQTRNQLWTALPQHGRDPIRNAVDGLHRWEFVYGPPRSPSGVSLRDKGQKWLTGYESTLHP